MDTSFDFENFENITIRKKHISASSESLKSFESSNSEYLVRSLPDLSTLSNENEACELREEIKLLKNQLDSAHAEIENLSLENSSLKRITMEQENTITYYKKIYSGSPDFRNSVRKKRSNRKSESHSQRNLEKNSSLIEPSSNLSIELPPQPSIQNKPIDGFCEQADNYNIRTVLLDGVDTVLTSQICSTELKSYTSNRNIFILGTQQCKGLALQLIKSRENSITKCQEYSISSLLKPFATSDQFLNSTPKNPNYLVLCIGENDKNPTQLLIDFCIMLNSCKNIRILVLSVYKNKYLNEIMINNMLRNICKNFSNCTFINSHTFLSKRLYLNDLCNKINMYIDSNDYNDKYLTYNKKVCNMKSQKCVTIYRKGTIPYYFPVISGNLKNVSGSDILNENTRSKFFRKHH